MEQYITNIHIDQLRHLTNVDIPINTDKKSHLILTGKNGSGKTSLLNAIKDNLKGNLATKRSRQKRAKNKEKNTSDAYLNKPLAGIRLTFSHCEDLKTCFKNGKFVVAHFKADFLADWTIPDGVENVNLETSYAIDEHPVHELLKYMVHLKTQQSYAKIENHNQVENLINKWFVQFESALKKLMDDDSVYLKYDYLNYNFLICQNGRNPVGFNELSDGYSSAILIMADLLLRMDQKWLVTNNELDKSKEGIVLIDEPEKHLHLEMQRTILPFLVEMFPRLQFIVATHSPFVVNSLENAVGFDLENKTLVKEGLSNISYSGVIEGYFRVDELSKLLRDKFERYRTLVQKNHLVDDDFDEIMDLEQYLNEIPDFLSIDIAAEYHKLRLMFR